MYYKMRRDIPEFATLVDQDLDQDPATRRLEKNEQKLRNVYPECERHVRKYGTIKGRKPAIYTASLCVDFGLSCGSFWVLGTYLHGLLQGTQATSEQLPPVRRLMDPQKEFKTSDDLLLFCLNYWVLGLSQQQLAEKYECSQALISRRLSTALPYFRAAIRLCCSQDHRERTTVKRLKKLAEATANNREPSSRGRRGPVFNIAVYIECWLPPLARPASATPPTD